jgi:hypothetical protein
VGGAEFPPLDSSHPVWFSHLYGLCGCHRSVNHIAKSLNAMIRWHSCMFPPLPQQLTTRLQGYGNAFEYEAGSFSTVHFITSLPVKAQILLLTACSSLQESPKIIQTLRQTRVRKHSIPERHPLNTTHLLPVPSQPITLRSAERTRRETYHGHLHNAHNLTPLNSQTSKPQYLSISINNSFHHAPRLARLQCSCHIRPATRP